MQMGSVLELRKLPESEKITINLGLVDLGQIDLLVHEGFYSNRSDFIRTAIRGQIGRHEDVVRKSVDRQGLDLGMRVFEKSELEKARAAGTPLRINVLGLAIIARDVSAELAQASIASVHVLGTLQATPEVKAALRGRTV